MFPDEDTAIRWFENLVWENGRYCPRCGCNKTRVAAKTSGLPYYCPGCRRAFSVRIGTTLERSKVPLRKWAFAIYLEMTSLKGVSSMKLHRDLRISQKTAWFMLHRIRESWAVECEEPFRGPVEVDETYIVLALKPPRNQFSSTLSAWVLRGIRNIGCQIAALEVDFKLNFGPETGRSGQISRFGDDSTHLAPGACGQS